MADSLLTLADMILLDTPGAADIEVSDLLNMAEIIKRLAATEASNGTTHQYTKEIGAPVVGFRAPNTGRDISKSADELVTITLKILSANTQVDKALADAKKKGPEWWIGKEAERHLRQAFFEAEKQMLYGTGNDSDGFSGLIDNDSVKYTDSPMVIDAGGSTEDGTTSVWAIVTNDDETDVTAVMGLDGVIKVGETIVTPKVVDDKQFPTYFTPIEGWMGLQIGSKYSVGRICNLTKQAGKGLTDDLLSQLVELFPSNKKIAMLGMSRQSCGQLQRSRQTYSPTGAPAPLPKDYEDIPIVIAESISNAEAVTEATPEE